MSALPEGTILKGEKFQYKIVKKLGQGGFGITYLASVKIAGGLGAIDTNMKVAIKEFFMHEINNRGSDGTTVICGSNIKNFVKYREKFIQEAQNLGKLQHKHIINVLEAFPANNTVYFSMEFIGGGSLEDYINEKGRLDTNEAIRIAKQIGGALSFMHDKQMLHLDLKPGNVMMREKRDAVLIDFGLSKQYDESGKPETSTTVGGGTPGYAPIEQIQFKKGNAKDFPVTMDVYALGGTLYKMLTGMTPPYASDILNDGFPLYELQVRGVSDGLAVSIAKAMMPTKKDRYQSVAAFIGEVCKWETKPAKQEARKKDAPKVQNQGNKPLEKKDESKVQGQGNKPLEKKDAPKVQNQGNKPLEKKDESKPGKKENGAGLTSQQKNDLGNNYYYGWKGKKKNYAEALKWYSMAAEEEHLNAQFQLARMYERGEGTEVDLEGAAEWYKKAAKRGHANSQFHLAQMYENGLGMEKNLAMARFWYKKAADQGGKEAKKKLQELLQIDVPRQGSDENEARLTSSQMNELGNDYFYGRKGKKTNYAEAMKWYRKAAEKGNAVAQNNLGNMYKNAFGVTKDYNEAVKWFQLAAEQGNASGQYNLGLMYQHGYGVKKDYAKALEWYEKSAKKGNAYGQYLLAQMYENGFGTKKNLSHARYWYEKATAQGDEEAKKRLKELKLGNKKSEPKPSNNVEGAGMTPSQMCELGKDYYMGRNGKSKNLSEAFKWFGTAAKKGNTQAMLSLASMLERGDGVEKDLSQAQAWYEKAAAQGSEFAKNKLEGQKEKDDDTPGCMTVIGFFLQVLYPLLWWAWTWFNPEYHYPAIGTLALLWVCGAVLIFLCVGMKSKFLHSCITWGFLILETIGIYMLNYNQ